jgi:hypothetical protein
MSMEKGTEFMSIAGFADYQRREFCKAIRCPVQVLLEGQSVGSAAFDLVRGICQTDCIHSTYEFHHWLIEHGYLVVRPE